MSRKEIKELSKEQLKGNWKVPVLLTLLFFVIILPIEFIVDSTTSAFMLIILSIASILISVFESVGFPRFYLEFIKKDGNAEYRDILVTKKQFLKALGFTLLVGIISFVLMFIGIFVLGFIGVGSILLGETSFATIVFGVFAIALIFIPYIIFALAISLTIYIIIEEDLGVFKSILLSINMMKGYKWKFFVLNLSFVGWAILATLTLGIGYLWLIPYITLSNTNFYEDVKSNYQTLN